MNSKIKIVPCIPFGDSYPLNYYDMFYKYQLELSEVTHDSSFIKNIQTETQLIAHYNCAGGTYKDNLVYIGDTPVGLICYQVIDWLDDGLPIIIYIDHFYIAKEYARNGYGTALLNSLVKQYKKAHFFFFVLKDNPQGQLFWNKALKRTNMVRITDERCLIENEEKANKEANKYIVKRG